MRRRTVPLRLLAVAIFLVALNLRAALASLPPLVRTIQSDLDLSAAAAGLLTTLPVLCMGLFAPLAQRLARTGSAARRRSPGRSSRCWPGCCSGSRASVLIALLASTLLVGIGIALSGTVLPGIVKEHFRRRSGAMTGVYLLAMMVGATAAAALLGAARRRDRVVAGSRSRSGPARRVGRAA